jgi:hypothetical protein
VPTVATADASRGKINAPTLPEVGERPKMLVWRSRGTTCARWVRITRRARAFGTASSTASTLTRPSQGASTRPSVAAAPNHIASVKARRPRPRSTSPPAAKVTSVVNSP